MPDLSSAPVGSEPFPNGARRFSSVQRAGLAALIAAVEDGTGCAALTGEAGTGKTAVLDAAAFLLSCPPVQVIRVAGGDAPLSLKRLIAQIMGSEADDQAADAIEHVLERLLAPASPLTRTILMVDDAHALERDALAYLQLTCGLQATDVASLQILFAGRPKFWSLLESEQLRSLRDRIRFRPVLPRATPLRLVDPPGSGPDAVVAPPTTTVLTLAQRTALREVPPPAKRRSRRRYAMASGIAATVVIVSIGPLPREPPASQLPIITAGYAAPVGTAADPRGAPVLPRASAEAVAAPAFTHAVSLAPAMAIQVAAAAPEANATGGAPADATARSSPAAGAPPSPQADATGSPVAPTPGPAAATRAAPPASSNATGGPPASAKPAPPMAAGAPPAPADATAGSSPAAGTPPARQADVAGSPAAPTSGPAAAAGPAPHAGSGTAADATPAPPMTAGTPAAPPPDAMAGPSAATPPTAIAAGAPTAASSATSRPAATTSGAPAQPSARPAAASAWQGAGTPLGTVNATEAATAVAHTMPSSTTRNAASAPSGARTSGSGGAVPLPPAGKVAGLMPPSKPATAATPSAAPVPQPTDALPPAMVASLIRHGDDMLQIGDIAAARLLFQRAAEAGSAAAAIALGKTNDPRFLAETGARGIAPDPAAAADWYRRAAALGDRDADRLLDGLGASAAH